MSDTNDAFDRSVALGKAIEVCQWRRVSDPEEIVKTAEKFRAFLVGETTKEPETELPLFTLPDVYDGYVYFQFETSAILYRSATLFSPGASGSVSRINPQVSSEWEPVRGELRSREALRVAEGYRRISALNAAEILKNSLRGVVRFQ